MQAIDSFNKTLSKTKNNRFMGKNLDLFLEYELRQTSQKVSLLAGGEQSNTEDAEWHTFVYFDYIKDKLFY